LQLFLVAEPSQIDTVEPSEEYETYGAF
jgi:hypothetical protein